MKKNVSKRDITIVSIFLICTAAVLYKWLQPNGKDNPGSATIRDSLYPQKRLLDYNSRVYVPANGLAQTGDIVLRLGTDLTSEMLRKMSVHDPQFSHAGVIVRENDTVFVYHALGGELNPDQTLRREILWKFGHPENSKALGIYRIALDSLQKKRLVEHVKQQYLLKIPFDTAFDLHTKDKLYCSEFVANAFESVFNDTNYFCRTTLNNKTFFATDDLTDSLHTKKIRVWHY